MSDIIINSKQLLNILCSINNGKYPAKVYVTAKLRVTGSNPK